VEVVLRGELDSEAVGSDVGDIESVNRLVSMLMLMPLGVIDGLLKRSVGEGPSGQQDVEVAQSILAHILSVLDDDSLNDSGSIELNLPP